MSGFVVGWWIAFVASAGSPSAADYPSIQAALDAHPGQVVIVPAGTYDIHEKIRIRGEGTGLVGPGRIVQHNPDHPILEIERADQARVADLTLTRPEERRETRSEGILVLRSRDVVIDNVRVLDNATNSAAIAIRESHRCRITHSLIRNYMRISVDDRTASEDWGYAFRCTDGSGISIGACTGTLIEGNTIVEERLLPTREILEEHKLGQFVRKNAVKGRLTSEQLWNAERTDNWQQGSAIIVTSPEITRGTRIIGNHIENAAQGIDLHSDQVIVSQNVVVNSFIGMKAMHGSRNVLILGNQFTRNSLWAIGLMPGAAAHPENTDGSSIVAHNIISDFGQGDAAWIWGTERMPIRFDRGQQPDDPPLTDVLIDGNVVQSIGPPRFRFTVLIENGHNAPRGLRFVNNIFAPGTDGVANIGELP